jgi:hypothetical protein
VANTYSSEYHPSETPSDSQPLFVDPALLAGMGDLKDNLSPNAQQHSSVTSRDLDSKRQSGDAITEYPSRKLCAKLLVKDTISRDNTIGEARREAQGFAALQKPHMPLLHRNSLVT